MALVLLVGAGRLTTRTLTRRLGVNPGFVPHHVLKFGLSLSPTMKNGKPRRDSGRFAGIRRQARGDSRRPGGFVFVGS